MDQLKGRHCSVVGPACGEEATRYLPGFGTLYPVCEKHYKLLCPPEPSISFHVKGEQETGDGKKDG